MIYVGSAGWNIPRQHRERFAADGSQLQRYSSRLNAAEINSSFYRPHAATTYERWAAAVPASFRFAVKIPKLITHDRALTRAREGLARFLDEIAGLGPRLGPLLVQLPPSFGFEPRRVGRFFELLRSRHAGPVVCEPRHATWTSPAATRTFDTFRIARVAADPPRASKRRAAGPESSTTGGTGRPGRTFRPTPPRTSTGWPARSSRGRSRPGASSTTQGRDPRPATRSTSRRASTRPSFERYPARQRPRGDVRLVEPSADIARRNSCRCR
jgi:uncharacterized protein DUF72